MKVTALGVHSAFAVGEVIEATRPTNVNESDYMSILRTGDVHNY